MRRLARDAVLIAVTAAAVWVLRGDAQSQAPVYYGHPLQIICTEGSITNMTVSDTAMNRVTIQWDQGGGPSVLRGIANMNPCVLYPDLRTPTP